MSKSNPNFDVMFLYDYFPYVKVACLCFLHVYSTNLITWEMVVDWSYSDKFSP